MQPDVRPAMLDRLVAVAKWIARCLWTKKGRRLANAAFLVVAAFFIVRFFLSQYGAISGETFEIQMLPLVASIMLFWVYMCFGGAIWYLIARQLRVNLGFRRTMQVWLYSYLGRYIPGKVGILAGRLLQYKRLPGSAKRVTFGFALEVVLGLLSSLIILLSSLTYLRIPAIEPYRWVLYLLIAGGFVLIHPTILKHGINVVLRLVKRPPISIPITYSAILLLLVLYLASWAVLGLAFIFLIRAIWQIDFGQYFYVVGAYSAASIAGLLAVFTPSGLGVTEGILIYSLKAIVPGAIGVIIALVARLWKIGCELSLIGIGGIACRLAGRRAGG